MNEHLTSRDLAAPAQMEGGRCTLSMAKPDDELIFKISQLKNISGSITSLISRLNNVETKYSIDSRTIGETVQTLRLLHDILNAQGQK